MGGAERPDAGSHSTERLFYSLRLSADLRGKAPPLHTLGPPSHHTAAAPSDSCGSPSSS